MLDTSRAEEALAEARRHAEKAGLVEDLQKNLDYLGTYAGAERTRCRLFPDFAPYSFEFVMEKLDSEGQWKRWFNGGLVYHGGHDGHGSGSAPTLAVTVSPTTGWSIHT